MSRYKPYGKGWFNESYRHSLAARGIKTSFARKISRDEIKERFKSANKVTFYKLVDDDTGEIHPVVVIEDESGKLRLVGPKKSVEFVKEKLGKKESLAAKRSVIQIAQDIKRGLKPYAKRVAIAGSIRRKVPDPHDIDIVLIPKKGATDKIQEFVKRRGKLELAGYKKISGKIKGVDVDIFIASPKDFWTQMMFSTGPRGANIWHRIQAKRKGWILNQYGLFDKQGRRIAKTEREVYQKLGLSYRPPELRGLPRK